MPSVPAGRDASGVMGGLALGSSEPAARSRAAVQAPPPSVEVLVDRWNVSLGSADRALHAGAPYLPSEELGERRARLAAERVTVARLLRAYALTRGVGPNVVRLG